MNIFTDQNVYIIAHEYAFCPIVDAKYEPYDITTPEKMVALASPVDSIRVLIKYDYSKLPRP